jgi:small membrane protein
VRPVQFVLLAFVVGALIKAIYSYKHRGIRTPNFLFWTLVWMGAASIIIFPDATSVLARLLGIGRGADLIIYASLVVSFYLIFRIHLTLVRVEQQITELVRAIALEQLTAQSDSTAAEGD